MTTREQCWAQGRKAICVPEITEDPRDHAAHDHVPGELRARLEGPVGEAGRSRSRRRWLAMRLHALAGRLDPSLDFRCATSLTLTLESGRGWVLREDGRGIPVWYRHTEYDQAFREADAPT